MAEKIGPVNGFLCVIQLVQDFKMANNQPIPKPIFRNILRAEIKKKFVRFLVEMRTRKFAFEIY